ncbi:hypothetical protein CXB51_022243 [Gossypium anomalum]|uniref:RRM domain-containing protein n=1 Tax=Gossypium anomalum TaxID=47600 RepID=A0A8J6CU27_9ROSI|nr:hypothetical protein CXB51_022243 [Gossypium anomalum]
MIIVLGFTKLLVTCALGYGGVLPLFVSTLVFHGATNKGETSRNKEAEQLAAHVIIQSLLADDRYETIVSEIIKSKAKLYDPLNKAKDSSFDNTPKGLRALFRYHGDVVDVFIPSERCRNGNSFGFVRFNNERDAQRAILRLNGFYLLGKRIGVKMARHNGKRKIWRNDPGQKVQEQIVEIVQEVKSEERLKNNARGVKNTEKRIVQRHVEDELLWNLQKCLVCKLNSICDSKSLNDRIAKFGLGEIIVRRIQERHFLVEILDEELMDLLRQTEWSYLKDFFIKIKPWSEKLKIKKRVTWIEVSGVLLHCWNY